MVALENQWFIQMSLDCLKHKCLIPSLRLACRLLKKRLRRIKVSQSALHRVLSRLFLRICCSLSYIAGFWSNRWLVFCLSAGNADTIPGVSGNKDASTGVETDGQLSGRHIFVTRGLVPLAGVPQHDVPEAVHSRVRRRELLERALDEGNICVQRGNLLVSFHVDSKFLPHLCPLDQFVTDPAATVIPATSHKMLSLCRSICEKERAQLLSPVMNS